MNIIIIISGLLLFAIYFIWKILKEPLLQRTAVAKNKIFVPLSKTITAADTFFIVPGNKKVSTGISVGPEHFWWNALSNMDQLQLALMLTQKGLIVWEKYARSRDITYSNSNTAPASKIDYLLLQKTIDEITLQSQMLLPACDNKKINQYYYLFIGPVIALQDGNWAPPYQVKTIFLAVYNVLKSIVEQNTPASLESGLAISINQSLDCMDISKLYNREEITAFLKVYRNKL
ncbi:MAG: hypothetical protein LH615_13650, partial [Ferruginibacter sp.]|nr:hypothetical protein [Ferruginibacter sp.]